MKRKKNSRTRWSRLCGRSCPFLDDEGFTQEVVQASGSASFRYFPGSVSGSDGHYLSGNVGELQNIPGVGAGKAKRYGKEFIELIKRHVEENEIERPEDLRVRTVANKSKLKVSIIQRIDRKVALDEIAMTNGLEFNELLDEIEAIVYSGTRINIDYFLNDVMDEDHIDDIYEYFKDSETDDLEDAIEELGGDYTEEEIRLVRIKFLSEMAN